jgi:hypothetical protein
MLAERPTCRTVGEGIMASGHYFMESNMTLDDFRKSLTESEPPAELTLALIGLWWDAKDNCIKAFAMRSEAPRCANSPSESALCE